MAHTLTTQCFAMRVRIGHQKSLLTYLLADLCQRLQAFQSENGDARKPALLVALRTSQVTVDELHLLLDIPPHAIAAPRTWLITWAERQIDLINHAHPYGAGALMQQQAAHPVSNAFVQCQAVELEQWLANYDAPAAVILALTAALPSLLNYPFAELKTTIPIAIRTEIEASRHIRTGKKKRTLYQTVFSASHTPAAIDAMLKHCLGLHQKGRLLSADKLPEMHRPLLNALRETLADARPAQGSGLVNVRLLLNQLGFSAAEIDYLILLSLPLADLQSLMQQQAKLETCQ